MNFEHSPKFVELRARLEGFMEQYILLAHPEWTRGAGAAPVEPVSAAAEGRRAGYKADEPRIRTARRNHGAGRDRSGVPQRLLLVLLGVELSEEDTSSETGGTLTPVLVNDLELTSEISCTTLLEDADSVGLSWNMMMVSTLSSAGGALPSSDEGKPHLEKMAGDVL